MKHRQRLACRSVLAWLAIGLGALMTTPLGAHVGDPTVYFEGDAGPFPVRVTVRTPGVVPGLAEITLRLGDLPGIDEVTVRPVRWDAGLEGAPPADVAKPVRGEPGMYTAELWLMTSGSYSVYVEVTAEKDGALESGTAIVPVQSVATERLAMPPWLGAVLALLGLLLVAGLIRIAGAGVASTAAPGEAELPPGRKRAMAVAAVCVALVLYGGKSWWDNVDVGYLKSMFETFHVETRVQLEEGRPIFRMDLTDARWFEAPPLAPDHGKLMHMFLIRQPQMDVFAHLHPIPKRGAVDIEAFEMTLPSLPAGSYQVYADVTFESGFAQTLTAEVELPEPAPADAPVPTGLEPDPDDSFRVATPTPGLLHTFDDGHRMRWQRAEGPLQVDEEVDLRFVLEDAAGQPAPLEAYMGMMSHAVVRRHDGGVFVHLHPTGTISMASQEVFAARMASDQGEADGMDHGRVDHTGMNHSSMGHAAMGHTTRGWDPDTGTVSLPYAFPSSGTFRVWVQVKSRGTVYSAVFDAEVVEAS